MSLLVDKDYFVFKIRLSHIRTNDPVALKCVKVIHDHDNPYIPTQLFDSLLKNVSKRKVSAPEISLDYLMQHSAKLQQSVSHLRSKSGNSGLATPGGISISSAKDSDQWSSEPVNSKEISKSKENLENSNEELDQILSIYSEFSKETATGSQQMRKSLLSELISTKQSANNPFAQDFSRFGGQGLHNAIDLQIFIPCSEEPSVPLLICVKGDLKVEDVIGYALFEYFNESRLPELSIQMQHTVKWNLKIVEDDGEIDDDFPALDRTRNIGKFDFDKFALVEATEEEVQANISLMENRGIKVDLKAASPTLERIELPKGENVYVKVHLYSTLEVKQTTTMQMQSNMLLSDVFVAICKKRKYDPKEYVLKMADTRTEIPLDKTLAQLKINELCILKRDRGGAGDIFLRPPDEEESFSPSFNAEYKQYNVLMKQFVGKQPRKLVFDGQFIRIVASGENSKSIFDLMSKTITYHISEISSCKQIKKSSCSFKMTVSKGPDSKSFEFDASDALEAQEISNKLNFMLQSRPQPSSNSLV